MTTELLHNERIFDLANQLQNYAISKGYAPIEFNLAAELVVCACMSEDNRSERKQFLKHIEDGAKLYKETFGKVFIAK